MSGYLLSYEEFIRIVQNVIESNDVAVVEWMGDGGARGTIRVYRNPAPKGSNQTIVVEEGGNTTYFASVADVYREGLEGFDCLPIGVIAEGIEEDFEEVAPDEEEMDEESISEDNALTIDLIQWDCSRCNGKFFVENDQDKLPRRCPYCNSYEIIPITESD